jgi:hypothetical protein
MVTYSVICDSHQVPWSMVRSSIPVWRQAVLLPPWLLLCSVLDFLCRSQCSDLCRSVLNLCCTVVGTWISSVLATTVDWLWWEPSCSVLQEVEALCFACTKDWSTLISLLELEALCFAYWTLSKYSNCILKSKHSVIAYWTRSNCLLNCVKVL